MWNVFFKLFFHLIYIYRNQTELNSSQVFNGVRFTRSLVLCVMFCMSSLVLFFLCHCVVCPSSINGFWLPPFVSSNWFFFTHHWKSHCAHLPWTDKPLSTCSNDVCMSFIHWAHLPCTYKSLSTCSSDVCPLIELTYPVQINLSQHVPMMYVLSFSSPTLYR